MARSTHLEKLVTDQLNVRISNLENGVDVINDNVVDNAALADMAAGTVKGNLEGGTADPSDITLSDLAAALIADTETGNDDLWSAQKIANEISLAAASSLKYKGGYDAAANSPDLDNAPSGIATGATYTVTTNGDFFGEAVQIGDFIIAEVDDPTTLEDWTIVNSNIGEASTTTKGLVELATDGEAAAGVVVQGNDSRLSNSRVPTGSAGGDLTGSYPNPTLANGAVTGDKLADGGVDLVKLEDIPSQTLLGNNTGAGSAPISLTPTQIRSLINVEDNATGDQNASEVPVTATGDLVSTNVQDALVELQGDIDTLEGVSHDAVTLGTNTNGLSLTDQELQLNTATTSSAGSMSSADKTKLDGIETGATADQNASEVPYTGGDGNLTEASTNVESAIQTLDSEVRGNNTDITSLNSDITAVEGRLDNLEGDTHVKAVSGNAGISVDDTTQAVSAVVSSDPNNKISIDANGLFVNQRADEVSVNESDYYSYSHVQSAIDGLTRTVFESPIARRSVSGPVTFTYKDPKYQHFVVSADVVATLPSNPVQGRHFVIKNSPSSSNAITVNSVAVVPGDIYEIIYDGTEWVEY